MNEDQTVIDANHVIGMLDSEGWKIVKAKFDAQILDLQNINNIDTSSPDNLVADIKARKMATDILFNFLKNDVYGFVEQQSVAQQKNIESGTESFIERAGE